MSSNLAQSSCCGHIVRLEDLRGKPIEFRRRGPYAPEIGTRWDCPTCQAAYFVIWRRGDQYWSDESRDSGKYKESTVRYGDKAFPNDQQGKFVWEHSGGRREHTGYFVLDLSYYWAYNDEPMEEPADGVPHHLVTDNAEDTQWIWGDREHVGEKDR